MSRTAELYYKVIQTDRITGTNIQTTTNGTEPVSIADGSALSIGDLVALNNYAGKITSFASANTPEVEINCTKNVPYRDPLAGDTAFWLDGTESIDVIMTQRSKISEFAQFGEWKSTYNQKDRETVELLFPASFDMNLRNQLAIDIATAPVMVLFDCETEEYWKLASTGRTVSSVGVRMQPKLTFEIIL